MLFQAHRHDIGIPAHLQLSKKFFLYERLIFPWLSLTPAGDDARI